MKCFLEQDGIKYEFDAASPAQVFDKLAAIESVRVEGCGECESTNVSREVFKSQAGNEMRKLRCLDCGAQLDVAVSKKTGMLFFGRKNQAGELKGTNRRGWEIWTGLLQN